MRLKNNLPEQVAINYVDPSKYKKSPTALYMFDGVIHIVDELYEQSEVMSLGAVGIRRTGYASRDVLGNSEYTRCDFGTTVTITQG